MNTAVAPIAPAVNVYESDKLLREYLLFHYGTPAEILPYEFGPHDALNFPVRSVRECVDAARLTSPARALDLGCAVGGASFDLSRLCNEVVGIDFSAQFVAAAETLQRTGALDYERLDEAESTTSLTARVDPDIDRRRVNFETGDACDLRKDLGEFDVVLLANLIDRVSNPQRCLAQMPALLKSGGQLVITSPYTWLEEFTPRERWLARPGKTTLDGLHDALDGEFELVATRDLPFLIREHARKFQWSVAQATTWIRC